MARFSRSKDCYIHCVVLTSLHAEFTHLRNVYWFAGIRIYHAHNLSAADSLLASTQSTVLLMDTVFAEGTWREATSMLRRRHPLVPMVVIADPEDQPFLHDIYTQGACGIVWRPFEYIETNRMIRSVNEAWYERRALQEERTWLYELGNG